MQEVKPPWVTYPGHLPSDSFWRQPGEAWAIQLWNPYWMSLSEEQRNALLDKWEAPEEWRKFYLPEHQEWLADLDGPAGFILRNNLCVQSKKGAAADAEKLSLHQMQKPPSLFSKLFRVLKMIVMAFGGIFAVLGFLLMLRDNCN